MTITPSFWTDEESPLLLNPRLPSGLQEDLLQEVEKKQMTSTLWLQSSGTESATLGTKLVAIRKKAFLAGAQGCVDFYGIKESDIWLNSLPLFHVGGLAIEARCFLSGAESRAYQGAWSALQFQEQLLQSGATWASLVPTQVYDLVQASIRAPLSLRAVLVGGGALSTELYRRAKSLGWPLLPSYGMTETSALIAGAPLDSLLEPSFPGDLKILPHISLDRVDADKYSIHSQSLFSGYLIKKDSQPATWLPRPEPFVLDDRLVVEKDKLRVLGRNSQLVKILGESVNLQELTLQIEALVSLPLAIVATPHERKGFDLHLFVQGNKDQISLDQINKDLLPFQRIVEIHFVSSLPRTDLGKIQTAELLRHLDQKRSDGFQEN